MPEKPIAPLLVTNKIAQEEFSQLNLSALKRRAHSWRKYLSEEYSGVTIEGVLLYHYDDALMRERFPKSWIKKGGCIKYAIVIEFSGCGKVDVDAVQFQPQEKDPDWAKFIFYINATRSADSRESEHLSIDDAFANSVYIDPPLKTSRTSGLLFQLISKIG